MNSRGISLLLAVSIALVTGAFLSLVSQSEVLIIILAVLISGSVSYLLIFTTLEFLIFRDIQRIYEMLNNMARDDYSFASLTHKSWFHPLTKVNKEIYRYAEIKQKEIDELKKLEIFRREFIADVSHELKTPIFAAQGFIHTLMDGAVKDKTVRTKFLKKAAKSLDGLDLLVQDLLVLSQMESGDIRMQMETVDITTLIQEMYDQMDVKAEKKNISVKLPDPEQKIYVTADKKRIFQVLINLFSNAVKYTRKGGEIRIDLAIGDNRVHVTVTDNGEGIGKEHLNRIFERFYRVEKSRSKDWGGTGLGLAIVKHIVEAHNSRVQVASSPGKGSSFSFSLERAPTPEILVKEEMEMDA